MAKEKDNLFRRYASKLKLVSNNLCYGPPPKEGEEVEQRITISKDGNVRFSDMVIMNSLGFIICL